MVTKSASLGIRGLAALKPAPSAAAYSDVSPICVAAETVHLEMLGWPPFARGPGWLLQSILTWHGECALVGYGLERERCGSVGRRRL